MTPHIDGLPHGQQGGGAGFSSNDKKIPNSVINSLQGLSAGGAMLRVRSYMTQQTFEETFVLPFPVNPSFQQVLDAITAYNAQFGNGGGGSGGGGNGGGSGGGGDLSATIYRQFTEDDIAEVELSKVTSGLFSNGAGSITSFHTASLLGDTSASYVEVYSEAASNSTARVQFSVGYGHINGSGSIGNTTKTTAGNRESAAIYRQFRNVILAPNTNKFTFTAAPADSSSGYDHFYFLAFNRAQMREKVDPGNWELHLSGSTRTVKLIDDSGATTNPDVNVSGRVFNIVSGSIASGTADTKTDAVDETTDGAPGLFYPDLGILILNPDWLQQNAGSNLYPGVAANTFGDNSRKIYSAVSGAAYFAARREEEISSTSYFCRANNKQFNFSSNPTYETGSVSVVNGDTITTRGNFKVASFKGDPRAYITQVGLYDTDNELIAVAKLSQPVLKSFSREAVVKVKLDY